MKRRTLPAATTLTATAALLLTACGGGNGQSSNKIADAGTGTPTTSSPSASAVGTAARPEIELPSDLSYVFNWPSTDNAAKDAILSDSEQSIKAVDLAIANQNPLDKAYLFYYEGEAAAQTRQFIKDYVKAKARTTGSYRYYDAVVDVSGSGNASLVYCEDQSKAYDLYLKTKKVDKTPATKNSYVLYSTQLHRNEKGVWVIEKLLSQRGSSKCRP